MDRDQNAGTGDETEDVSYADRGSDNVADLTRSDENSMDRSAQSGTTGAFGAGEDPSNQQRRQDAADAFGGEVEAGSAQQSSAGGSGATSGSGVWATLRAEAVMRLGSVPTTN